jgi:hypothetical protein
MQSTLRTFELPHNVATANSRALLRCIPSLKKGIMIPKKRSVE